MKKVVSVLMVLVLLSVGLCGCVQSNQPTTETTPTTQPTEDPIEKRKAKLEEAYMETGCVGYGLKTSTMSSDRTTLMIDTNPDDSEYYSSTESSKRMALILAVNEYLGLPASVKEKMSSTRALDGLQTQNCGDYTVSWTYHPDNGLRVIYEVNFS